MSRFTSFHQIRAIALATWREARRDRLISALVALLAVALVAIGALERARPAVVLDLALSLMSGAGVLVAIFLGTSLVHKELDKRTLYFVLSKPVSRFQFLAGKLLGLLAALGALTLCMGLGLAVLMAVLGAFDPRVLALVAPLGAQIAMATALALLFATMTSGSLSAIYAGGLFVCGTQALMIKLFAESEIRVNAINYWLGHVLYHALPNFGVFDLKNDLLYGQAMPWGAWGYALAYGAGMSLTYLALAAVAWESRELP